jgi:hypothetical protein
MTGSRSSFVTVVAWIFIVLSGFATMIAIAQNILIQTMLSGPEFNQALASAKQSPEAPAAAHFMLANARWFFVLFLVVSVAMLVAAIGLLKRWNWARLMFIGLMALAVLWQLGGLVGVGLFMSSMPALPEADAQDQFQAMFIGIMIFTVVIALVFAVLFGWIVKRLVAPAVVAEFRR